MMCAWWLSRRLDVRARTRRAFAQASRTTGAFATNTPRAASNRTLIAVTVLLCAAIILAAWVVIAHAEEAIPGTAEASKRLVMDNGTWGALLGLALTAVVTLFGLLMRANGKIAAVIEKARADAAVDATSHAKELADQQEAFARERAEWHANTTLLQEQRLSLLREVMTGLNNSSNVIQAIQASVNERTQTAAELASQIQALVATVQLLRSTSSEDSGGIRKKISEMADAVEALATGLRRST